MNVKDLEPKPDADRHRAVIYGPRVAGPGQYEGSVMMPRVARGDTHLESGEFLNPDEARAALIAGLERLKTLFTAECDSAIEAVKKAEVRV